MDITQCYETLGLPSNASQEQIKEAYRELVKQWHPDRVAHNPKLQTIAEEELKVINSAYEILESYKPFPSSSPKPSNKQAQAGEQKRCATEETKRREREAREQEAERLRLCEQREKQRLRIQQEAEAAYQREQLIQAKAEADRKQQEARRVHEELTKIRKRKVVCVLDKYLMPTRVQSVIIRYKQFIIANGGKIIDVQLNEVGARGRLIVIRFESAENAVSSLRQASDTLGRNIVGLKDVVEVVIE